MSSAETMTPSLTETVLNQLHDFSFIKADDEYINVTMDELRRAFEKRAQKEHSKNCKSRFDHLREAGFSRDVAAHMAWDSSNCLKRNG